MISRLAIWTTGLLVTCTALTANPLVMPGCATGFVGGADLLIAHPCTDDLYLVIKGPTQENEEQVVGRMLAVEPDYQAGFRVYGGAEFCDGTRDIQLQWERLRTSDTCSVTASGPNEVLYPPKLGPNLDPTGRLFDALARSRVKFHYDAVDLVGRYCAACYNRYSGCVIGGLRYARITFSDSGLYQGTTTLNNGMFEASTLEAESRAWGVGPRLGMVGRARLCGNIWIMGDASVGILLGEICASHRQSELEAPDARIDVTQQSVCEVMPLLEARAGFEWVQQCGCFTLSARAGYEVQRYFSAILRLAWTDDVRDAAYAMSVNPFDVQGFFVGLRVQY